VKLLFPSVVATLLAASGAATAATPDAVPTPEQAMSPNEQAGLPDLKTINRPAAKVTSKVDINDVPRTPSYHERDTDGTEITEYRDRGKPVEIDVRSNLGTHYKMTAPTDASPVVHDNGHVNTRLPSVHFTY
jgi:hypothetical protein